MFAEKKMVIFTREQIWLSGVAVAYQRCRASDRGSVPALASGR